MVSKSIIFLVKSFWASFGVYVCIIAVNDDDFFPVNVLVQST